MTKAESAMMQKMGIWIDRREAVLVSLQDGQTTIKRIESNAESHFRPSGGWKSSGTNVAQSVSKEQTVDERRKHQLRNFYHEVIEAVHNADLLYIFGPGEAKGELVKEIEKIKGQPDRISAVDVCDSLTENQLVAQVKSFFTSS